MCLGAYIMMVIITTSVLIRHFRRERSLESAGVVCLFFYMAPLWLALSGSPLWVIALYCILPSSTLFYVRWNLRRVDSVS